MNSSTRVFFKRISCKMCTSVRVCQVILLSMVVFFWTEGDLSFFSKYRARSKFFKRYAIHIGRKSKCTLVRRKNNNTTIEMPLVGVYIGQVAALLDLQVRNLSPMRSLYLKQILCSVIWIKCFYDSSYLYLDEHRWAVVNI